jgi:hypothetical protein
MSNLNHPNAVEAHAASERMDAIRSDAGTAKAIFFVAALLSLVASVYLFFSGQRTEGIFVGLWVPSILASGALLLSGPRHE